MKQPTRVSLVRHGTVHNPDYIFYGRLAGYSLNADGCHEARRAGRALQHERVAAIYSSPLMRARQTAREIGAFHKHLKPRICHLLTEVLTAYEGGPAGDVDAVEGDIYTGAAPGFEQPADIFQRAQTFVLTVRKEHPGTHTVAVTHGDIIAFMIVHAKGLPLVPANKLRLAALGISGGYPAPGSITTFTYTTDLEDERPETGYYRPGVV